MKLSRQYYEIYGLYFAGGEERTKNIEQDIIQLEAKYDKYYDEKKAVLKLIREPFYWIEELTDRQREALNLACRGIRGKEMSERLGLGLRAAIALTNRAVAIINEAEDWDITPKRLPDILLKLIENELGE